MNLKVACRAIAFLLRQKANRSATCQEILANSRTGKRLLTRISFYKRTLRFSRSKIGFSLPNKGQIRIENPSLVGKLSNETEPEFGNQAMASGAAMSAQHIYLNSDAPRLDSASLILWESSDAAAKLKEAFLWLINRGDPPLVLTEVPIPWWQMAIELRATCQEEPEPFAFAYFIWSVMSEPGSTIDGI